MDGTSNTAASSPYTSAMSWMRGDRDTIRQRLFRTVVAVAAAMLLAGCQEAVRIDLANNCRWRIEVQSSDVPLHEVEMPWKPATPGQRIRLGATTVDAELLFLAVLVGVDPVPKSYAVPIESLVPVDDGTDTDWLVALGGKDCSPQSADEVPAG